MLNIFAGRAKPLLRNLLPDLNKGDTGVGGAIAGRRADLVVIDDPIRSREDADSETVRDKIWDWYINDFVPRLKPNSARVIIANHRNEDDLVGRLLQKEADKWADKLNKRR